MIRLTDDSEKEPIIQLSPMIDLVFLLLVVPYPDPCSPC